MISKFFIRLSYCITTLQLLFQEVLVLDIYIYIYIYIYTHTDIHTYTHIYAGPSSRAVKVIGLRPLAY